MKKMKDEYVLNGLDCGNCARKIETGVSKMDGVEACSVNFATGTLTVTHADKQETMSKRIEKTVQSIEPHVSVSPKEEGHHHDHDHGTKNLKAIVLKLIGGAVIGTAAYFIPEDGLLKFITFFAAYLLVGGDVVFKALKNIVRGQVFDENFLMTIATAGAFVIQQYPEALAVMLFYQIGELFQGAAVNRSRRSISELMNIRPEYANLKVGNETKKVKPEEVKVGDRIVVKPGEKIPLDGLVIEGFSLVDTSELTGESVPRDVEAGKEVLAGFVNQNGILEIEVQKGLSESAVTKILDLVENASSRKAQTENFITKFAKYYTPAVVVLALLLAFVPPLLIPSAQLSDWVYRALVFLVISCPCALVVSIPLGFFGGIGAASKRGILVKGSNYLEALNSVSYAVFDKTGTLTKGNFTVTNIVTTSEKWSEEELLSFAALAEAHSSHPIAESIKAAYGSPLDERQIEAYENIAGHGIKATISGSQVLAGNHRLMEREGISYEKEKRSGTVVYMAINGEFAGSILIADELKDDAIEAVSALKASGIQTVMLTGDAKQVGTAVAQQIGIDEVHAELLPQDKVTKLEEIDQKKAPQEKLLFVGDGINDTPVLARADIGIAMGGLGSDAAVEAADIVIMTDQPSKVAEAIAVAKRTRRIVWQNIAFALGVKGVFLLLGAFGFATMWEAVFSDVGVTVLAVLNAMRVMK
ncbi:cadmium-translocating P-type ATPase [Bacillus safensis]|uniref:heavy metal translocating P-type ATPase n=1 Tax=Bacillus safensis TaxID=561879 RepID=UPI00094BE965|nr:heavy metal translocating P-type ATPase [Bacillus safensis]APT50911.1 cadmium-translocating P-type ATPase [Bacillus safensis]APT52813.1 cadmium-translocating P-type ATPase [Bacillus safensis]